MKDTRQVALNLLSSPSSRLINTWPAKRSELRNNNLFNTNSNDLLKKAFNTTDVVLKECFVKVSTILDTCVQVNRGILKANKGPVKRKMGYQSVIKALKINKIDATCIEEKIVYLYELNK